MAERIKYQYINSAKWGTEKLSEPNTTVAPRRSEPNSGNATQRSEPNSKVTLGQLEPNSCNPSRLSEPNTTGTPPRSESNSSGSVQSLIPNSTILREKDWIGAVIDLPLSAQKEGDSEQQPLFDFIKDSDGVDQQSVVQNEGDSTPDKDPSSDDESDQESAEDESDQESAGENGDESEVNESLPTPPAENSDGLPPVHRVPPATTKEELIDAQRPSEMVDGPLRGVAMYRTSTEEESDENAQITIDQQEPLVNAAIKAFNIQMDHEPIKDRAVSGENYDRDGLEKIEELAEAGEINVVIVSDIDRIGRICEKTIKFVKKLRYEYEVYVVANVRWYDVSNGDDLETFNAKAGRAEAENKKRGGRGNRGKLFKLVEHGSDSYLSWFRSIPVGCEGYDDDNKDLGIKLAEDERREIPRIALEEFMDMEEDRNEYARTEERVRERLFEEYRYEYEGELDIKKILQDPIYTGRAVLSITQAETHSVDQAEIVIEMEDLQLFDEEYIEMWEQAQEKIERIEKRERDKKEARPGVMLSEFGPEMIDDVVASWTLICPKCGSTSDYEFHGFRRDADGTKRQKCKCTGGEEGAHFFRVPTRDEYDELHDDNTENQ